MKNRIFFYDVLRALACMMVVIVHSPKSITPEVYHNWFAMTTYTMMTGVSLFFLISGALLLPMKSDIRSFFKKRFSKILWPTIFWTVAYLIYSYFISGTNFSHVLTKLCIMPLYNVGGEELWFMYTLIGLYLIVPILSPWLKSAGKTQTEFYLILWAISLFIPYLINFSPQIGTSLILHYINGFAGYFILGFYLRKYYCDTVFEKHPFISSIVFLLIWITPPLIIGKGTPTDCLSISLVSLTLVIYILIKKMNLQYKPNLFCKFITTTSKFSFGIYLSHVWFSKRMLHHWDWLLQQHIAVEIIICTAITFACSFIFCYLINLTPLRGIILGIKR